MQNNEFDKVLQEKLEGHEVGFNAADWQKMEALLPQDSRKPFLLIALLFGILLFSIGGLIINHLVNEKSANGDYTAIIEENKNSVERNSINSHSNVPGGHEKKGKQVQNTIVDSKERISDNSGENLKGGAYSQSEEQSNITGSETKTQPPSHSSIIGSSQNSVESVNVKKGGKKTPEYKSMRNNAGASNPEVVNSPPLSSESNAAEFLSRINAGIINQSIQDEVRESTTAEVKRKRGKVFEFGLGAGAGPMISFIDANYLTKSGYSVGISQEFMFVQRVGLVLSESYAHREYDGGQYPCTGNTGFDCPQSYSSDVKSMDFGIDIKANLISKSRWDWYVKAGIINVLKIKETFEYHYTDIDTLPPLPNTSNLSTNTNFNGSNTTENFDAATGVTADRTTQPDLTISGTNRYHAAYHFATGFDVSLNSRMKLQFDAGYSFTKRTVGPDDKRLHSAGLNGRMLFLFGK